MATIPLNLLQAKIFGILDGAGSLDSLMGAGRVFDDVPDNQPMPYIEIGDDVLNDFGGHTFSGFEGTVTINVWSEALGKKECKEIQEAVYTLLHNIDLALAGFNTINFRYSDGDIIGDPDGRTHHGIQLFNIMLGGN